MPSVFSLIISLAVVALSGAVVLFIVLREENQPATSPPGPRLQLPEPEPEQAPPPPSPAAHRRATIRSAAPPAPHRVRSAVLLVLLLATVGALLALVVAVALGLLVMAMRAGIG